MGNTFRKEARATVWDIYAYTVHYSMPSSIVLGSHWCCECPPAQPRHTLAAVAIGDDDDDGSKHYNTMARNLADMVIQLQLTAAVWSINHDFVRAIFSKAILFVRGLNRWKMIYCLSNQHVASCCFMFCVILCVATERNMVRKNYSKGAWTMSNDYLFTTRKRLLYFFQSVQESSSFVAKTNDRIQ